MNSAAVLLPPQVLRSVNDLPLAAAFLAGNACGALPVFFTLWALSGFSEPLTQEARVAVILAVGVTIWTIKHGPLTGRIWLPENRRQIPATVFGGSLVRGAFRFGLELGTGMRTYVPAAAPYVLVASILMIRPTLAECLALAAGWALGRAMPVVVQLGRAAEDPLVVKLPPVGTFMIRHAATWLVAGGAVYLVYAA